MNTVGKELGLGFAGMGYEPKWPISERPNVNKVWIVFFRSFKLPNLFTIICKIKNEPSYCIAELMCGANAWMQDGRFDAVAKHIKDIGNDAFNVMYQTCTAQVRQSSHLELNASSFLNPEFNFEWKYSNICWYLEIDRMNL